MNYLDLAHATRASGRVRIPGSKSISNRTLLLAALARGTTTLTGLLESDDTRVMLDALRALGIAWRDLGDGAYEVPGAGGPGGSGVISRSPFRHSRSKA